MLRLEHVFVRWSLSVCVGCVCVCVREREIMRDRVHVCDSTLRTCTQPFYWDISIMVFTLASDLCGHVNVVVSKKCHFLLVICVI